jgi:hypothetical protein
MYYYALKAGGLK